FYLPKIKRIFIPYVFFSFFATSIDPEGYTGLLDYVSAAFKDLLTGGALLPYWFMPVLFQLYLLYPLVWYFLVIKRVNPLKILIGSFIFSLISYFLFSHYWLNWQAHLSGAIFFAPYFFFFVLGVTLKSLLFVKTKETLQWLFRVKFFHFSFLILFLYLFIGLIDPLNHYYNVRLVYGPALMMIILYLYSFSVSKKISLIVEKIGRDSLYIYLLHFIILLMLLPFIKLMIIHDIYPVVIFASVLTFDFAITYGAIHMTRKVIKLLR
ncbi:MAG: acyltransferase family protein, partial [Patescibacteria group bacterium]